jgi:hypothetical protein
MGLLQFARGYTFDDFLLTPQLGVAPSRDRAVIDLPTAFSERHLHRTITEYVEHYHRERNHQGLENELIEGAPAVDPVGCIRRRRRLGGLLNYYCRAA